MKTGRRKPTDLGRNLPQCHFAHQKSHTTKPGVGSYLPTYLPTYSFLGS